MERLHAFGVSTMILPPIFIVYGR